MGATPKARTDTARPQWHFTLYIAGATDRSAAAIVNLRRLCEAHLVAGDFTIDTVDLVERPELARGDAILAIPTLVRRLPAPIRKVVGDLSDERRVLIALKVPSFTQRDSADEADR